MIDLELLAQGIRISIPYVLAAVGGAMSERGGVINIALEGILLVGAFAYVVAAHAVGDPSAAPVAGLLAAAIAGAALAGLHALFAVWLRAEQIVSGVAINLLALGLTEYLLELIFHSASNSPRVPTFGPLPLLGRLGSVGDDVGHPLLALSVALVVGAHVLLYRTRFGLRLRAVGEHPDAAASLGIRVLRVRTWGVVLSGVLAGVGGAYLVSGPASFTAGMSGGRGYIALAAMIVGKWRPGWAAGAGCLFGMAEALQIRLQATGAIDIPSHFVEIVPHVLTLLVLCGLIGRAVPPSAIGRPFHRERG